MGMLNYQQPIAKNVQMIDAFGGLNKRFRINENEFSDILNMTADDYPVLSTRRPRQYLRYEAENIGKISSSVPYNTSSIVFVDDVPVILTETGELFYKNNQIKIENCYNNKLIRFGNMLYAYPSGVVISLPKDENEPVTIQRTEVILTYGTVDDNYIAPFMELFPANFESIENCDYYSEEKTYKLGEYCWRETDKGYVLERYCGEDKGWEGMISSLIKIPVSVSIADDSNNTIIYNAKKINAGDVVFIEGTDSMNGAYLVEYVSDYAIYLQGNIDVVKKEDSGRILRKLPELDFVIEHHGRLWGCRSGYSSAADNKYVNEIYCTALNSPMNWYKFQGTSQDSFALSLASEGRFTGAAVVGGYVTFFKEQCVHRIYGTLPENYQLYTTVCNGIQEKCENSLVLINGTAFYKSPVGIMILNEGYPVKISDNLGPDNFINAFAGTDGTKYFLVATDIYNERFIYVYDTVSGLWHKEDCPDALKFFVNYRSSLYAFAKEPILSHDEIIVIKNKIKDMEKIISESSSSLAILIAEAVIRVLSSYLNYKDSPTGELICFSDNSKSQFPEYFSEDENISIIDVSYEKEKNVSWHFVTGDIGYSVYTKKYINKIAARMQVLENANVDIDIEYNNDGIWYPVSSYVGEKNVKSANITIIPSRCESFKLKFHGTGEIHLLSLVMIYEEGSEK